MNTYRFQATDQLGRPTRGRLRAESATDATRQLSERGLTSIAFAPARRRRVTLGKSQLSRKDLLHLTRQLAAFLGAGIPVVRSLRMLVNQDRGGRLQRDALSDMIVTIQSGESLAVAASAHPEIFPAYYLGILQAAEVTGNVDVVLGRLASYIERDLEERRKLQSALLYPALVVCLALVAMIVITTYVLPKFQTLFDTFDAELPRPTRMLLWVAEVGAKWLIVLAVLAGLWVVLALLARSSERVRLVKDRLVLRLPLIGRIVRLAIIERFARMLGPMTGAGIPLPEAMFITARGLENRVFRNQLVAARGRMIRGEGIAEPLAATRLFPDEVSEMIAVGEETGTVDAQLEYIADYSASELDFRVKRLVSLFEPALIITVGLMVGFVAIAMVSAIYGIYHQVEI